jgi:YhcH/YjgK/YiaL family protein
MITDILKNSSIYESSEAFRTAFRFLKTLSADSEEQRYELGNGIYAVVESYMTKPETKGRLEAHRKFIDIQMLLTGREKIGWHNIKDLSIETPYDSEKDIMFFAPTSPVASFTEIENSTFMLLFPEDAHMPQIQTEKTPEKVKKVVVKIPITLIIK